MVRKQTFETDVFIVGGGPAGLAAGIAASRKGLRVVVADGNKPPIDKACGEGLMPDSRRSAEKLGIDLPDSMGYMFRGIRFHGAGRSVESDFPHGHGIGIRRTALHEALVAAAERAGVELRWNTPVSNLDGVKARWIVGADGSGSRVRRWADLGDSLWNSRRFAYRQHYAVAPWTNFMEIYWGDGCQIYVTPVAERELCVVLISRRPELRLSEALERYFPFLRERLGDEPLPSRERGAITATMRLKDVARGNVALIGDASGSVDVITGEGICLGFRQAEKLAEAMAAGSLKIYNQAHPRLSLRPHVMAQAMLMLDRGAAIRQVALGVLSAQPWMFKRLLAVHAA